MRLALGALSLVLGLAVSLPPTARADAPHTTPHTTPPPPTPPPPTPPPPEPWRDPYHRGTAAYDAGRLDEALADFQSASALGGPSSLLYDIALTLDRLGRTAEAVRSYHQYLDAAPDAPNRDVVEARLEQLEQPPSAIASHVAPPPGPILSLVTPDEPDAPPATSSTSAAYVATRRAPVGDHLESQGPEWVASWVMLGLTAATSVAAILVWQDGLSQFTALQDLCASPMGCTAQDIASSSAHAEQDATNALLGVSIGLGALTILTFVVEGVVTGNRTRLVRGDAAREGGLHFALGLGGVSIAGSF
ncbi:MAG: tetratricopeptide repeat protein [Sandaracinus sp.]